MKERLLQKLNSLSFRSGLSVAVTALALLLTLGLTNYYSFQLLAKNMRDTMVSGSQLFAAEMQGSLDEVSAGLLELVSLAANNQGYYPTEKLSRYLTQKEILQELDDRATFVETADLFYFYRVDTDELLMSASSRMPAGAAYQWETLLRGGTTGQARSWHAVQVGSEYWLTLYYEVYQIRVGAAVRMSTLFESLPAEEGMFDQVGYAFADRDGLLTYASADGFFAPGEIFPAGQTTVRAGRTLLMAESSGLRAGGRLIFYRPLSEAVMLVMTPAACLILLLGVAALVAVTLLLLNTNRQVARPIAQLTDGVKEVERGNWEYQLQPNSTIREFQHLFGGFNHMIREVRNLKIQAYEAELERQRSELRYLQLQIRPHFYLNAITTISSLTYQDRREDVRQFIDALGHYLRYLFSGENTQVRLAEEIAHCESFIRLQQIKCPDKIFSMVQLEPDTQDFPIPKFLVQTLVENIFKHGFSPENFLSIFIRAEVERRGETAGLHITVEDNGCGFPQEVLRAFPQPDNPAHVGLNNLHHTLKLIYGGQSGLTLSNAEPSGARVEIFLPKEECGCGS